MNFLQKIIDVFIPKPIHSVPVVKNQFQLFLEKRSYVQGKDLLVLPDSFLASSSINPKKHQIIYLRFLTSPAVIKS